MAFGTGTAASKKGLEEGYSSDVTDVTDTTDDSSIGDEEEMNQSAGPKPEVIMAYEGQVKSLVKMFEKFAKNLKSGGGRSKKKEGMVSKVKGDKKISVPPKSFDGSSQGASSSGGGDAVKTNGPVLLSAGVPLPTEVPLDSGGMSDRLTTLETKVDAIVTFINDLVFNEIGNLESNYFLLANLKKDLKTLETKSKALDDDIQSVCDYLDSSNKSLHSNAMQIFSVKKKLTTLEKAVLGDPTSQKLNHLNEQVGILVEAVKALSLFVEKSKEEPENSSEGVELGGDDEEKPTLTSFNNQ